MKKLSFILFISILLLSSCSKDNTQNSYFQIPINESSETATPRESAGISIIDETEIRSAIESQFPVKYNSFAVNKSKTDQSNTSMDAELTCYAENEFASYVINGQIVYTKYDQGWILDQCLLSLDDLIFKEISMDQIQLLIDHSDITEQYRYSLDYGPENYIETGFKINGLNIQMDSGTKTCNYFWLHSNDYGYFSFQQEACTTFIYNEMENRWYFDTDSFYNDSYQLLKDIDTVKGKYYNNNNHNRVLEVGTIDYDNNTIDIKIDDMPWASFSVNSYGKSENEVELFLLTHDLRGERIYYDVSAIKRETDSEGKTKIGGDVGVTITSDNEIVVSINMDGFLYRAWYDR